MDLEQIQVGGVKYNIKDSEARSGLAQAEADIADIRDKLPSVGAFNDIPWTDISSKVTVNTDVVPMDFIWATKVSGWIMIQFKGIWKLNPGYQTVNMITINDEIWYGDMPNDSTIGIVGAWQKTSPYFETGRAIYYDTNKIGCGEYQIRNGADLRFLVQYKALHP